MSVSARSTIKKYCLSGNKKKMRRYPNIRLKPEKPEKQISEMFVIHVWRDIGRITAIVDQTANNKCLNTKKKRRKKIDSTNICEELKIIVNCELCALWSVKVQTFTYFEFGCTESYQVPSPPLSCRKKKKIIVKSYKKFTLQFHS